MHIESVVDKAIRLYREGKLEESRDCLRNHLLQQNALLWLAKVSLDSQEAALVFSRWSLPSNRRDGTSGS